MLPGLEPGLLTSPAELTLQPGFYLPESEEEKSSVLNPGLPFDVVLKQAYRGVLIIKEENSNSPELSVCSTLT